MNNIRVCDIFKSLHSECIYIFNVTTFLEIGLKENIKILHSNSLFYNCIQISPKYTNIKREGTFTVHWCRTYEEGTSAEAHIMGL